MYNMSAWLRLFHRTIQDKYKRKPRIMIRWALAFIFAAASFEIKIATVKAVAIPGGFESSADSRAVVATTRHGAEGGAGDAEISDDYDSGIIQMRKMLAASSSNGIMGADLEQLLVDKIPVDQFDSSFGGDQNLDSGIPGITTLVGAGSSFAKRLHQDAFNAYAKHVYPTKFHKDLNMEYHGVGSSKGLCRLRGYDEHCKEGDTAYPTEGKFMFGASDYPYTPEQHEEFPTHTVLPVAASAVVIVYNVPGLPADLRPFIVDMPTVAKIFTGQIKHWRDPEMIRLNPDTHEYLPDANMSIVVREDGSGTTVMFKTPLVPYDAFFKEQADAGNLKAGGPGGWPDANGTFIYRDTNSKIAYAMIANPYSIAYVGQNDAMTFGLDMFSISEDCIEIKLESMRDTAKFIERMPLPDEYHGWRLDEGAGQADANAKLSYIWPFIGYTYLTIRNAVPSGGVTCEEMSLTAKYMIWYYEADIVHEIAELHAFGLPSKQTREMLVEKIKTEMSCNGKPLVPAENWRHYSRILEVEVGVTASAVTQHLLDFYFVSFRAEEAELAFKPVVTEDCNVLPESPFGVKEDFRVMPMPSRAVKNPDHVWLPWIMSGIVIQANLPNIDSVKMSLETLSLVLSGSISKWNDAALVKSNPALESVDEPISTLVHPEIANVLADALNGVSGGYNKSLHQNISGPNVIAYMEERGYTLALLPGYKASSDSGVIIGLQKSADSAAVKPSKESFSACLWNEGVAVPLLTEQEGCYPLAFPVVTIVKQQYAQQRNAAGRQTILFWYWMLGKDSIESNGFAVHIYRSASPALQSFIEQQFLSVTLSNGEPIIKVVSESKLAIYVIIGISCMVALLLVVVLALGFLYHKSRKELEQIEAIKNDVTLDTESPAIKIMKFLQGLINGEKLEVERVKDLLFMLRHTDNLQAPDISRQIRKMKRSRRDLLKQDNLEPDDEFEINLEEFGDYIMSMLETNESARQSDNSDGSSQSGSLAELQSRASMEGIISLSNSYQLMGPSMIHIRTEDIIDPDLLQSLKEIIAAGNNPIIDAEGLGALMEPLGTHYFCNVVHLQPLTGNRPLSATVIFLLHEANLIKKFKLDREKLVKYIMCIEDNYPSNEYHNRIHAAFVVQRTYVTFMKLNLRANSADKDLWLLAAVLGAAVHDVLHPGYNNQYMVLEEATVARTYNDQAVLENQSLYMALELMRSKESNFIHNSSLAAPAKWRQFKTLLIKIVLATDMSNHFAIVATFQQKFSGLSDNSMENDSQPSRKTIADNAALIMQMLVKTADLGHCYSRVEQHLYWSKCLEDEFFKQGDSERTLEFPISPLMDRQKPGVMAAKNQTAFFAVIILPMLEVFVDGFPGAAPLAKQAKANVAWWKTRTADNYSVQDLSGYSSAMVTTMARMQRGSLRDWPTILDRETGVWLPEADDK